MLKRLTKQEFIEKARAKHGCKYDYSKVEYINNHTKVCIICPEHGEFWQTPNKHLSGQGCPKCALMPKNFIFGVGVRDIPLDKKNKAMYALYGVWQRMLERCYEESQQRKTPTYIGCCVCDEWLYFSAFYEWCKERYIKGWQLDKDILVKGNKCYSPQTCCFVPPQINSIFAPNKYNKSDHLGVEKEKNGWYARVGTPQKNIYGKMRRTQDEAFEDYKRLKKEYIVGLADSYREILPQRVYEAICNFDLW